MNDRSCRKSLEPRRLMAGCRMTLEFDRWQSWSPARNRGGAVHAASDLRLCLHRSRGFPLVADRGRTARR